jgi:hypothetical protein
MAANFGWEQAENRIKKAAQNALEDVGYILYTRRLNLDKGQEQLAAEASKVMGQPEAIRQAHISMLEDGKLQGPFKNQGYGAIDAVLEALDWRGDRAYMRHMLHEFARVV